MTEYGTFERLSYFQNALLILMIFKNKYRTAIMADLYGMCPAQYLTCFNECPEFPCFGRGTTLAVQPLSEEAMHLNGVDESFNHQGDLLPILQQALQRGTKNLGIGHVLGEREVEHLSS